MPAVLAIGGAVAVGVLAALQARINAQLGVALDDGLVAAVISFGSGLAILLVLSALLPVGRAGIRSLLAAVRSGAAPWWMLIGGAAGALTVATQGLTVAIIGVSLFTVGMVAGQTLIGIVVDRIGYGPAGVTAVTMPRVIGAALALVAVAFSLGGDAVSRAPLWMLVLPLLVGFAVAWQQATNGRLRAAVGSALAATTVNFVGGTAVLAVAALVHVGVVGAPEPLPAAPWLYLGGAIGCVYIFMSAALVARTGVLLFGLASVLGQLVGSVVLDAIWPPEAPAAAWQSATTVALASIGVVIAAVRWRRRRRHAAGAPATPAAE